MLRDITLGQYYSADSVIHRLDPRVKLSGTLIYIVALFLFHDFVGFVIVTAFLIWIIAISKLPPFMMLKGIRGIWVLLLITFVCNLFFTRGETVLWQLGVMQITSLGVQSAVYFAIRLIYLVVGTSVMTLTTTPNKLTDGMEEGLKPLTKIRVPVHEIAMMMSIALRFIPILIEEADKIKKAQMARGACFDEGKLLERVKSLIPILVPLFVSAFRRANDLAMAMEARCYRGGEGRSKMRPLIYASRDYRAYIIMLIFLSAMILIRIFV